MKKSTDKPAPTYHLTTYNDIQTTGTFPKIVKIIKTTRSFSLVTVKAEFLEF